MARQFIPVYLLSLVVLHSIDAASQPDEVVCGNSPHPHRAAVRHIENKGIGYRTGYTTLETFFSASPDRWSLMPFLDLRGHVFNNGTWAANGGIGLRKMMGERVYGAYSYYDFRNTSHKGYNQISFGLETLGVLWDLRLNGYVGLGNTKSSGYRTQFSSFTGNSLFLSQKQEYALSGGNGEIGFYPLKMKNFDLYTVAGSYYLKGPSSSGIWGGQARAKISWKDYVALEVSYSYDHHFKNIVQGQLTFSVPFGRREKIKQKSSRPCQNTTILYKRMVQPVVKAEIIPVTTGKQKLLAMNPTTNQPYNVWFVDNLSHSAGTYESPFSTLADAQNASGPNDIIYVFPGDHTTTGMDSGISLKSAQQLLGATTPHTLNTQFGTISITPQATGTLLPVLSNTDGVVVTASDNNVISGLYIQNNTGHGILAASVTNLMATQNCIQGVYDMGYNGIELDNAQGIVLIDNTDLVAQAIGINVSNTTPIANAAYIFSNIAINDVTTNIQASLTDTSNSIFSVSDSVLVGSSAFGLRMQIGNGTPNTTSNKIYLINNQISSQESYPYELDLFTNASCILNASGNTFFAQSSDYAFSISTNNDSSLTANINNNTFLSNYFGISIEEIDSSSCILNAEYNIFNSPYYTLDVEVNDEAALASSIKNNTFYCSGDDISLYMTSNGSSSFTTTIADNNFYGGVYTVDVDLTTTEPATIAIVNNNIQTSSMPAIYFNNSASDASLKVQSNIITGNGVSNAIQIESTGGTTTLQFNNNAANYYPNAFYLNGSGLTITSENGNQGQIVP